MSAYCSQNDILAYISITDLLPLLDDTSTGNIASPAVQLTLNSLIGLESAMIDGMIANIYDVPISPTPPLLNAACTIFVCESLYQRRLAPDEKNVFADRADVFRERINDIGQGKTHLDLRNSRDFPQGAVNSVPLAINFSSNTL